MSAKAKRGNGLKTSWINQWYISKLEFDISSRRVTIFHNGQTEEITNAIYELKLDSNLLSTEILDRYIIKDAKTDEKKLLISVLLINLSFFIIELYLNAFQRKLK